MRNASVGLVMAARNAAAFLERAVVTVQQQDFEDFVCCVVDDGSSDDTEQMARDLITGDRRFSVIHQEHQGVSVARNQGVARLPATKYLSFPDSDDELLPEALRYLVSGAEALGGAGAHALAETIDEHGELRWPGVAVDTRRNRFTAHHLRRHPISITSPSTFASLAQSCTIYPPGAVLCRRDLFDEVGGFDPTLWQYEDWDLNLRIARHGDYAFVNEVVILYRHHSEQMTNNPYVKVMGQVVAAKTLRSPSNSPGQKRVAREAWRAAEFHGAFGQLYRGLVLLHKRVYGEATRCFLDVPVRLLQSAFGPFLIRIPVRRESREARLRAVFT
jgi:glycosyltransferase involved in cell wall biosynthesis